MLDTRVSEIYDRIRSITETNGIGQTVTVVAVTKNQPETCFADLEKTVICDVGENRPQALAERSCLTVARKHLIGHLQTNKAKLAVRHADLIQSVDSVHLAKAVEEAAAKEGKVQDILLQVNIAKEEAKFGIYIEDLPQLLAYCSEAEHLRVRGLMSIMPKETQDRYYRDMYDLFQNLKQQALPRISMEILSMGMSGDFERAVRYGANMVRIGSYLFS